MRREEGKDMKRDGRKLDHRTLEAIRKMAAERVREEEKPCQVTASHGFCRPLIYRWLKAANGRGRGLCALASHKGTSRPRKLTSRQEQQVFRWINGKNPMQCQLDGVLWSRAIVRELIQRKFGVGLSLASVGALLARLGLTAQNPLQRAYPRKPGSNRNLETGDLSCDCARSQANASRHLLLG
jgi:transposase